MICFFFFFSSRRRHTRSLRDWSSDVCSSDLVVVLDCFADRDTRGLARRCRSVVARQGLRFDARALLAAAAELAPWGRCAGLVYGSGFEGRTGLLGRLARGRRLYGNEPSVVAAGKDVR